jgi:hypothetical protein
MLIQDYGYTCVRAPTTAKPPPGRECWPDGCWQRVVPSHSEEKLDLADKAGSATIPNAAGGVGGHRAAKPHAVIRSYISHLTNLCQE